MALLEEDYAGAVRIRDHPYMKMYSAMGQAEHSGRVAQSNRLRGELYHLIHQQDQLNKSHSDLLKALNSFRVPSRMVSGEPATQ